MHTTMAERWGPDGVRWWEGLDEEVRTELARRWRRMPMAGSPRRALEVPLIEAWPEDRAPRRDWHQDLYEYLLDHPDSPMMLMTTKAVIGTCTAHPRAREVLRTGRVDPGFHCPLARGDCPWRRIVDAAGAVRLVGHVR